MQEYYSTPDSDQEEYNFHLPVDKAMFTGNLNS